MRRRRPTFGPMASWFAVTNLVLITAVGCGGSGQPVSSRQPSTSATTTPAGVSTRATTPADLFDHPPAYPGYQWSLDGRPVGWQVATSSAGPPHCDWQTATSLTLGWPPGTFSATSAGSRQYIRDPHGAIRSPYLHGPLELNTTLPTDARPTGLSYGGVAIYISAAEVDSAVYVVGGGVTERWPRSDPPTLCA